MQLVSDATFAEFPIDISLEELQQNSRIPDADRADHQAASLSSHRGLVAPVMPPSITSSTIRHVARRVRGEKEHPICDFLRLSRPVEHDSGFAMLVRIARRVAPGRSR